MRKLSEELTIENAKIRIDAFSDEEIRSAVGDPSFLTYRLGQVEISTELTKAEPDMIWRMTGERSLSYENGKLLMSGAYSEGEVQRMLISLLVKALEDIGLFTFHASACYYGGRCVVFMSGEDNHGKTMSLLEVAKRGGEVVAGESLICNQEGQIVSGSKDVFLKSRPTGAERIDKPPAMQGVNKFFDTVPVFKYHKGPTNADLIVLPDIDGNFDAFVGRMESFEKEYQTFHCLGDFYVLRSLVSSRIPMPIVDDKDHRHRRAAFIADFARERPYYFVRGRSPGVILNELDKILGIAR
jgi:hypothetical protein